MVLAEDVLSEHRTWNNHQKLWHIIAQDEGSMSDKVIVFCFK